jgi:hypothetical protein
MNGIAEVSILRPMATPAEEAVLGFADAINRGEFLSVWRDVGIEA